MRPTRRQILQENGMVFAPPEVLRMFWRRYNTARRPAARMGELAAGVLSKQTRGRGGPLEALSAAWESILPREIAEYTTLESLRGGRLRVVVADAGTRFVLSRQLSQMLTTSLNEALGKQLVKQIEFRIGRRQRGSRPVEESANDND
ncbi:MAG TPA: DUF721 domain-containing protein [Phycisphaerae bacterium]|nr:DUF721 domain-containing protein [Phycisphaerae bacterium]